MNAGQVARMVNRETGSLMGVYRAAEAGLDTDAGAWAAVCEDHGSIVNTSTARLAHSAARDPRSFCEGCREGMPNRIVNRIASSLEKVGMTVEITRTEDGSPFWGIVGTRGEGSLLQEGVQVFVSRSSLVGGRRFGILRDDSKIRTWRDLQIEIAVLNAGILSPSNADKEVER
jgi:hypothetical protein